MTYTKHRSTAETLAILDSLELDTVRSSQQEVIKKFGWDDDFDYIQGNLPRYKKMMMIIWQIFEEPRSSTIAKFVTVISIFFIIVSILSFVLQTLSMFRITEIDFVDVYINKTATDRTPALNRQHVHPSFDVVEWICNTWFIFEIMMRFIVSPNKKEFCKSFLNIIDFLGMFS
jgi:potassium voltage-gated channel Shaw-related subfamily C protein